MTTGFGSELRLELIELFLKGQITENKKFQDLIKSTKSSKSFTLKNFSLQSTVYCSGNVNTNVTASSGE